MNERLSRLRDFLRAKKLDAVIVTNPKNRRYLSGFTGSSGYLLITCTKAKLITDFRYLAQAGDQAKLFEIIRHGANPLDTVAKEVCGAAVRRIGFESDHLTFSAYDSLRKLLKDIELQPVQLNDLRMIKDAGEIALIKTAVEIADAAFSHVLSWLRPGLTEIAVAAELEFAMRRQGAEKPAFDTIVASGVRGALPHGIASDKVIAAGDLVTMDFGAVYQGYHSDITRTVCIGRASARQREIYHIVLSAQLAGVKAVQAGRTGKEVDAVSRQVITEAGYGEYFGHGLGHGVGLAIHEAPALSPGKTEIVLAERMLVTVEPGIYLPDWGGVRIEDTVVVNHAGCDILTASSKEFVEIG